KRVPPSASFSIPNTNTRARCWRQCPGSRARPDPGDSVTDAAASTTQRAASDPQPQTAQGSASSAGTKSMGAFILELIRPYRKWLVIVFIAMRVETAMSLAGPWPVKVIIDNVVGSHPLPEWLRWVNDLPIARDKMGLAVIAAIATVLIAAIG